SALLDELKATRKHPTADELFHTLRHRLPRISLATVYRNLDRLVEDGLIRVLDIPGQPRRYDGDLTSHYHVRCVNCGRVDDVMLDRVPDLGKLACRSGNYRILGMRIEFEGLCEKCRKAKRSAGRLTTIDGRHDA
ncbi:MAG: transcriptional repressor, partial [bacterium]